jgi:hypothetical protein
VILRASVVSVMGKFKSTAVFSMHVSPVVVNPRFGEHWHLNEGAASMYTMPMGHGSHALTIRVSGPRHAEESHDAHYFAFNKTPLLSRSTRNLSLPHKQSNELGLNVTPVSHGKQAVWSSVAPVFQNETSEKSEKRNATITYIGWTLHACRDVRLWL